MIQMKRGGGLWTREVLSSVFLGYVTMCVILLFSRLFGVFLLIALFDLMSASLGYIVLLFCWSRKDIDLLLKSLIHSKGQINIVNNTILMKRQNPFSIRPSW